MPRDATLAAVTCAYVLIFALTITRDYRIDIAHTGYTAISSYIGLTNRHNIRLADRSSKQGLLKLVANVALIVKTLIIIRGLRVSNLNRLYSPCYV